MFMFRKAVLKMDLQPVLLLGGVGTAAFKVAFRRDVAMTGEVTFAW